MMTIVQGGNLNHLFLVNDPDSGVPIDADATPTVVAYLNGAVTGAWTLTVTRLTTGRYKVSGTLTGTVWLDWVQIVVVAVVKGASYETLLEPILIDNPVNGVVSQLGIFGAGAGNTLYNWLNAMANAAAALPGAGLMGNYDPATDSLEAIRNKVDALAATGVVTVVSPVSANGTQITLVQGDDYKNVDGRALAWSGITGLPDDISAVGNTVALKLKRRCAANPTVTTVAGTITTAVGATKAVRFDLPAATTGAMDVGAPAYDFAVEFSLASGSKVSAVLGTVTVLDDAE